MTNIKGFIGKHKMAMAIITLVLTVLSVGFFVVGIRTQIPDTIGMIIWLVWTMLVISGIYLMMKVK